MTCSLLIPTSVAEKTVKKLQRLAKQAGVTLEHVPGQSAIYRKVRTIVMRRDHVTGVMKPYETLKVDPNVVLECNRITVGELPSANGYKFLGKIVHTEAGNMLQLAPSAHGTSLPVEWKTAKPTCDHCKTKRTRKDTFIIQEPNGAIYRVGRNCLADFLRSDPASLIAISAFQDELSRACEADEESEGGWGFGGGWGPSMWWYLCCCFSSVRLNGFVKSRPDDDRAVPTSTTAMFLANPCTSKEPATQADWKAGQPTDVDVTDAIGTLLWLEENTDSSDYIHNLKVALQMHSVKWENRGLVASLPAAYARAMGLIAAKKARPADGGHWGAVGGRSSVVVTVLNVITCEPGQWGTSDMIKMITDAGQELVTFTTNSKSPSKRDIGKRYEVRGTVKKHDSYQGRAQTILSRCDWTDVNASEDDKEATCDRVAS